MRPEHSHLTEAELIHAANGELSGRRKSSAARHLETCWHCRERMKTLEATIVDFVRARNTYLNSQLPDAAGPKALLRARLAESPVPPQLPLAAFARWFASGGRIAVAGSALAAVLAILLVFQTTVNAEGPRPRTAITPGETRPITLEEVCRYPAAEVVSPDIPASVQSQVFAAYGIKGPQTSQFEVDYLITPDLGGAESMRNLWPQPYSARWNARVKDKLEQRLHELVCGGKLDLATAQRDIAVDWIAAYKKYVGANTAGRQ